jgi:hypothetical protein
MWQSASAGSRSSEVKEWPLLRELDPEVELPLLAGQRQLTLVGERRPALQLYLLGHL